MEGGGGSGGVSNGSGGGGGRREGFTGKPHRRDGDGIHAGDFSGKLAGGEECGDPEAWSAFAESFSKVQSVLDRNRVLIQQANKNHQSRMSENMVNNVAIIQELNGNISKVASIYSDLSTNFTGKVRERRQHGVGGSGGGRSSRDNGSVEG